MTNEEKLAEEWIKEHSGLIGSYRYVKYDYSSMAQAFLAGLKAGKDMTEADLATVAYMQGAERYKPKWHYIGEEGLPAEVDKYYFIAYQTVLGLSGGYCKLIEKTRPIVNVFEDTITGYETIKMWECEDSETTAWLNERGRVYAWKSLPDLPEYREFK